jgi:hypothetical protein
MKFKVGDKVKIITYISANGLECPSDKSIGIITTIKEIDEQWKFPYYCENGTKYCDRELQLIETNMSNEIEIKPGDIFEIDYTTGPSCGNCISGDKKPKYLKVDTMYDDDIGHYQTFDESMNKLDECSGCIKKRHLKLKKEKGTFMQKLNIMMKKLLDNDIQILIKAGYIDGDLKMTQKGQEALNAVIFDTSKADLVKLAQVELDEEKDEK